MDRRSALKALAAAPWALTALPSPAAIPAHALEGAPRRLTVFVFLYGGNDGFNTWVPYTDPLYYKLRPTIAVPRDMVLKITDRHGFHPAFEALMPAWTAKELAVIQGVGYNDGTQQHYRDGEIAFTAEDQGYRDQGWITRALGGQPTPRRTLAFGLLDIRGADPMGPFRGDRLPVVQVHHARELLMKRRVADCAIETNTPGEAWRRAGTAELPPSALATRFPDDAFGEAMQATVELAACARDVQVVHVTLNGRDEDKHHSVDTHWDQNKYHGDALRRLAEGLAALRAGLKEIGRWDESLVVTYDEFGRAPVENADHGTHHGVANTHFMMGGRVNGGLHGDPAAVERVFAVGGPAAKLDTRHVWSTVARDWWAVPPRDLFDRDYRPVDLIRA